MAAFIAHQVVHAHLPLPPAVPHAIPEVDVISDRPFPSTTDGYAAPLHAAHATSAALDPQAAVLARTIFNGYVLELRPLAPTIASSAASTADVDAAAIRVFFPDALRPLAGNCVVTSLRDGRLYVFAVSEADAVYRLNFALGRDGPGERHLFVVRGDEWCDEFEVPSDVVAAGGGVSSWSVIDEDTVALGCSDGGIIRVVRSGHWAGEGSWSATQHRASSRLRIGSLFSRAAHEHVVSLAGFQHEDQLAVLYTLSQDAKIRTWSSATGQCLRTFDVRIPSTDLVRAQGAAPPPQLESAAALIRVVPHPHPGRYSHLVVAFILTPHSATAGTFVIYRASNTATGANDLAFAGERACSPATAGAELRAFEVLPPSRADGADGWRLWAVWDAKGVVQIESVRMDDIFQFTAYHSPPTPYLLEWQTASSDTSVERLDAAYYDSILGPDAPDPTAPADNNDITATFIEQLFLPGRFSALTLSTVLEQYVERLPRHVRDAQLSTAHPSLPARYGSVVGAHLELAYSPQTGAPDVEAYRKALKLEWLGVWAQARELDKQARWPLATAVAGDQVLVLAREAVVAPVPQDTAGVIVGLTQANAPANDVLALPEGALKSLYPRLAPPLGRRALLAVAAAGAAMTAVLDMLDTDEGSALEAFTDRVNVALAEGLSESVESLAGGVWDELLEPYLADDDRLSVRRALSECSSVPRTLSDAVDLLSDAHLERAPADTTTAFAGLGNALVASTIQSALAARYAFARNALLVAHFYLAESTESSSEDEETEEFVGTLARCFVVYHRYRVLYWLSQQTAVEARERAPAKKSHKAKEDVLPDFGSLKMGDAGAETDGFDPSYSLVHALLVRYPEPVTHGSANAAYHAALSFLDSLGLFNPDGADTDVEARASDVELALKVLVDGHPLKAGQLAELYAPSAGMAYVKGRAGIAAGLVDGGVAQLQQGAAACRDASLRDKVPGAPGDVGAYYRHAMELVERAGLDAPVVLFGELALQAIADTDRKSAHAKELWTKVFLAQVALSRYEDAYSTLTDAPFTDSRKDLLGQLISAMCEANAVDRLNALGFIGFQKDVEERLNYKARNSDPLRFPNYYKVLYTWHISRGDYRSAAEIMYAQAQRFRSAHGAKLSAFELVVMQARSYLASINALALVDKRNAWFAVHTSPERAKRRKVSKYIPEDEFSHEARAVDIVTLADVQAEYTSVLSLLRLSSHVHDLHEYGVSLSPSELVGFFVQRGMFDLAQSSAASLGVDMTDLFTALAVRCVELARLPATSTDHAASAYLAASPLTARLRGPPAALALRYIQLALERHDGPATHWRYRCAVRDVWLERHRDKNAGWVMPAWLVEWEMARDPEGWIGAALKWGWVAEALDWAADLVRKATPPELLPRDRADVAYLPYALIDRVLAAAGEGDEKDDKSVQQKAVQLRAEVERRVQALAQQ